MRRAATLLVCLLALPPAVALGLSENDARCEGFAEREGIGPSCPVEGGFEVVLPDGHRAVTHGVDPVPGHLFGHGFPADPRAPVCIDDPLRERHAHVIYARPVTRADRSEQMVPELRAMVALANGLLHREATELGAPSLDYRLLCDADGQVRVDAIVLPSTGGRSPSVGGVSGSTADFYRVVAAARALGYDNPNTKYWIWVDDPSACSCAGVAEGAIDTVRSPSNPANGGPHYALTFGYSGGDGAFIMMHESGHTLGAVSNQAPYSSGAGHCNDGRDVMCYADGGPFSNYRSTYCTDRVHFDCGHNTYFHTRPAFDSYLGRAWNIGAPLNRFVQGCLYEERDVAPVAPVAGVNAVRIDIPAACHGARYAALGEHITPGTHTLTYTLRPPVVSNNVDVCWHADDVVLRCDAAKLHEEGVVPEGATHAVVSHVEGFNGRVLLSVI